MSNVTTRSSQPLGENNRKHVGGGEVQGKVKTQGRCVLGSIDNVGSGRVQPFRAAKQNATTEGFFSDNHAVAAAKTGQTFKIFDESEQQVVEKKPQQLHPAVTQLPTQHRPLSTISSHNVSITSTAFDSPMVLDVDDDERLNIFDIDINAGVYGLSEYAVEIFQHLREAEKLNRPKTSYMRKQQDITNNMRSILIDWLVEVSDEYKLHIETTHLAVNYIDRFLSQMAVLRGKLQLVGAAAMFLAAKFEEIYPPEVGEFVYITDDTYTKKQVLRMEHLILKVLNFDVAVPTSNQFLKRFQKAAGADKQTEFLSQYLCELALIEYDCIEYLPSMMAASAVCLASYVVCGKIWDSNMEHYMEYSLLELTPCIKRLSEIFSAAEKHPQQALFEKYKDAKYDCVSKLKPPTTLPFDEMEDDEC